MIYHHHNDIICEKSLTTKINILAAENRIWIVKEKKIGLLTFCLACEFQNPQARLAGNIFQLWSRLVCNMLVNPEPDF